MSSDKDLDILVNQAATMLEQGSRGTSEVLEELLSMVPADKRDEVKKRFNRAVVALSKNPKKKKAADEYTATNYDMAAMPPTMRSKIEQTMRKNPAIEPQVNAAGKVLFNHGVQVQLVTISLSQLGELSPQVGVGTGRERDGKTR